VQPEVAKVARTCTYDSSGIAWSDAGADLNWLGRVEELHSVLRAASVGPPYVIAGLSVGALVARLYARQHRDEVGGVAIIDHAFIEVGADSSPPAIPGLDSPPVLIHKEPINLTVEETSDFRGLPKNIQELHRWAMSLKPKLPTVETAEDCLAKLGCLYAWAYASGGGEHDQRSSQLRKAPKAASLAFHSQPSVPRRPKFHSVEINQPEVVIAAIRWLFDALHEP
jgi:pimeloyl-ACP methyl ester carboxylesterase